MAVMSYSNARKNFKKVLDQVHQFSEPIVISRNNGKNAVVISEEEYNRLMETIYLMRNPKNAIKLIESIEQIKINE